MAWQKALLLAILLDSISAIRESVELTNEEARSSLRLRSLQGRKNHSRPETDAEEREDVEEENDEDREGDKEEDSEDDTEDDTDEDREDDKTEEVENKGHLPPGKDHREAKWIYKTATDGFHDLDKVVESIDAAADDASSKAKRVDTDYTTYRGNLHDTSKELDRLSLSGQQFKKEVVDYFANAETDKYSPLARRVPDRDFIPNSAAVEKLRVAEVSEHPCEEPAAFCCAKGMVWSEVLERTPAGCEASEGECSEGRLEHPAVSRLKGSKDRNSEGKGHCVPKDAARLFRKSSDWEDENRIEDSDLLSDLALLPEAENILAEKLSAANTPKQALVQSVCRNQRWVSLLDAIDAQLCGEFQVSTTEREEGEDE